MEPKMSKSGSYVSLGKTTTVYQKFGLQVGMTAAVADPVVWPNVSSAGIR